MFHIISYKSHFHTHKHSLAISMDQQNLLKDLLTSMFKLNIESDFKLIKSLHVEVVDLARRCKERGEQIKQLQTVVGSTLTTQALELLVEIQDEELEKNRSLMRCISETQIKVLKTISFLAKMKKINRTKIPDLRCACS